MQALVAKDKEPITPFIAKVRALHEQMGVSSIIVIGGCGDYFSVADHVIMMENYRAHDVTAQAKGIAADPSLGAAGAGVGANPPAPFGALSRRVPDLDSIAATVLSKTKVTEAYNIKYGPELLDDVDLKGLEQIVEISQTRFILDALAFMTQSQQMRGGGGGGKAMQDLVAAFDAYLGSVGIDGVASRDADVPGNFARARPQELAGTINRLRSLRVRLDR